MPAQRHLGSLLLGLAVTAACAGDDLMRAPESDARPPDPPASSSAVPIPGCDDNAPTVPLTPDPNGRELLVRPGGKSCGAAGSEPFATVQDAVSCSAPGDHIYLLDGTYDELRISNYRPDLATPGTVPRHLYISAAAGARIVIDPKRPLSDWESIVSITDSSYITLANLIVTNSALEQEIAGGVGSVGIAIGGETTPSHHISLYNNEVYNVARHAITLTGGSSYHLERNHIHDVALLNRDRDRPIHDGGIATARRHDTTCFKATRNSIHDVFGECLVAQRVSGGLFEGNTVYNCYSVNIYLDSAENMTVSRNNLYSDDLEARYFRWDRAATGIAIARETAGGFPARNHQITNNVIFYLGIGIQYGNWEYAGADNYYAGLRIAHNVIKEMSFESITATAPWSSQPGTNRIENNIVFKPWRPGAAVVSIETGPPDDRGVWTTPSWEISHNLFANGVPTGMPGDDGTNRAGDPAFVTSTERFDVGRYKLGPGSAALHAGRPTPVDSDFWYRTYHPDTPSIGIHEP
ncbi:MAG: right-handed parallel beta-helix repeat-containing protein [Kofleriaceae bacterium]